ncbi:family 1 glycosylhydrolase, partial [Bacillus sp. WP8]|uniref:family 1 glycosylhydrolase n=1 Tax=Bacillus sp. WP8 TaxID=756828 RepID=UPI00119F6B20
KDHFALFPEIAFQTLPISIPSTPIFPTPQQPEPNHKPLQFYHPLFPQIKKHNIQPILTLSHYQIPLPLTLKYNPSLQTKLIHLFLKFANLCFERYKHDLKYSLTFNQIHTI